MAKSLKPKNSNYIDSEGITHNRNTLKGLLDLDMPIYHREGINQSSFDLDLSQILAAHKNMAQLLIASCGFYDGSGFGMLLLSIGYGSNGQIGYDVISNPRNFGISKSGTILTINFPFNSYQQVKIHPFTYHY